jgi:hypothetical protein
MMITTLYSLVVLLIEKYIPKQNIMLSVVDVLLIVLSIGVIVLAYKKWKELRKGAQTTESVA